MPSQTMSIARYLDRSVLSYFLHSIFACVDASNVKNVKFVRSIRQGKYKRLVSSFLFEAYLCVVRCY